MKFAELEIATRKEFPGFLLKKKSESRLMKTIDVFLKIITLGRMRTFMTEFITTVDDVVYVPTDWEKGSEKSRMIALRHERIHMRQSAKYTKWLFRFLYLCFPLPVVFAYFRMKFEWEAYTESMWATAEYYGLDTLKNHVYRSKMIGHFTTAEYFWAWPWSRGIENRYNEEVRKIEAANTPQS